MKVAKKLLCFLMAVVMLGSILTVYGSAVVIIAKNKYPIILVHGMFGWGANEGINDIVPYYGATAGDLVGDMRKKGYDCYSASVGPLSSVWDQACELYAQLTGTVVDYGKEHSERCKHARYGEDYTGRALVDSFSEKDKINLLGHSFGGATVRMFATIMAQGSDAEKAATDAKDLSPYFQGGKGDWIYSVTSLAAPHNGTTAYCTPEEPAEPAEAEETKANPFMDVIYGMMDKVMGAPDDGRIATDNADYDMVIDNALELNKKLPIYKDTYYFSYACSSTEKQEDGTYKAINSKTEFLFRDSANEMGRYTGVTEGGYVIDEKWLENDGLVNTISAKAPEFAPSVIFNPQKIERGVWNIMPVEHQDHMGFQGGQLIRKDINSLYYNQLDLINRL